MRLKEKVAVVTGAASGIGRASAIRFGQEGARLVIGDVNEEGLQETAATIQAAGGSVSAVRCDVSVEEDVKRLVETAVATYGRLDVMFNNAGIGHQPMPVGHMDLAEFQRTLSVNLNGVFLGCKYAAPIMAEQGGGSIINTASILGLLGSEFLGAYNASKGAIVVLTKNVAADYGPAGVRCNAIAPGLIDTPIAQGFKELGIWDSIVKRHMLRRAGRPEEVAAAALFLASDDASFVTGATLVVDGGISAH